MLISLVCSLLLTYSQPSTSQSCRTMETDQCVAWCACLLPFPACAGLFGVGDRGSVCDQLVQSHTYCSG